jgi:hypothetical protein
VLPSGIGPALARLLQATAPDLLTELFTPGRVLTAEVVSVFQDRAMLSFGRGIRLEVALQAPLQEGQRVQVQVQPAPAQPESHMVLKVIGPAPDAGTTVPTGQTTAVQGQAPAQPGAPQVMWLPIPLPDGTRGWAQLQIQEDDPPRKAARQGGGPAHKVRIWWETPALGPVQATLEATGSSLSTIFTAAVGDSRESLQAQLPDLQHHLAQAGFPEARLGCRQAARGEAVEPAKGDGSSRLDQRM